MVEEFTNFPAVLKRKIGSFLDHSSAVRLANVSKTFHSDVALSTLIPSYELIGSYIWHGEYMTGDIPIKSVRIPIFGIDPHTIQLTCRWKDQGWGNRKGKVFVVAQPQQHGSSTSSSRDNTDISSRITEDGRPRMEADEAALFGEGRFVYKSPFTAAHHFEDLQIVFTPQKDEVYHLWVVVGGGGGHLLIVEDLCVRTLVFDDSDRTFQKAYASLHKHGVIDTCEDSDLSSVDGSNTRDEDGHLVGIHRNDLVFHIKLLKQVLDLCSQSGRKNGTRTSATSLASFISLFHSRNLHITDSSYLPAMVSICNFCLQFLNQESILSRPPICVASDHAGVETLLPSFSLQRYFTLEGETGDSRPAPRCRIPFIFGRTKSIKLSCTLQDYGDSGTGRLYVIAKTGVPVTTNSNNQEEDSSEYGAPGSVLLPSTAASFDGGRIVWESPIALREKTSLEVLFPTNDTERYYLYQASGGTRDSFSVNSLSVQLTIVDDSNGCFQQSYTQLVLNGAFEDDGDFFQTRLLLAAIEYLQEFDTVERDGMLKGMYQFFESHNFATDVGSLRSLRELVHALLDFKEQQKRDIQGRMPDGGINHDEERPFRMFSVM
jgi:hypothetical protein